MKCKLKKSGKSPRVGPKKELKLHASTLQVDFCWLKLSGRSAGDYSDTSNCVSHWMQHSYALVSLIQSTQTWKTKPINSARGGATGAGIISKDGFVVQDFFTGPFEQVLKLKMGAHMWNQFGSHFYARGPILSFSSRGFGSKGHVQNFLDIEVLAKGIIWCNKYELYKCTYYW